MTKETRTVIVEVIDLEDPEELEDRDHIAGSMHLSEAASASRTAALVAPAPPDPDYFVG